MRQSARGREPGPQGIHRSLARIDRHIERGNELFEQNRRAFEENRRAFEENRTAFEGNRTFMRELLLRHEKVTNGMIARLEEGTREIREQRKEFDEHRREFIAEMRAQRAALFRILDRLDGGGATAGA